MPGTTPSWRVTAQRPDYGTLPTGAAVHGVTVTITLASGTTGDLFIPDADYTAERARELIAAKAAVMAHVDSLSG